MAGECRARPSACASGMLGKVKAGVGHGRLQAGSTTPCPEARPQAQTYSRLGGKI